GTGHTGLKRIVKAGVIPVDVIQRHFHKWIPTAYDLFGVDGSSSAEWAYVWGLKGRFDEETNPEAPARTRLNEYARSLYLQDIQTQVAALNALRPAEGPKLTVPDVGFTRAIGRYKDACWSITGEPIDPDASPAYLGSVLPTRQDQMTLDSLFMRNDWIAPPASHPNAESPR